MDTEPAGMDNVPSMVHRSDASNVPRCRDGTLIKINQIRFSPVLEVAPLGPIVLSEVVSTERGEGRGKILNQVEHQSDVYED